MTRVIFLPPASRFLKKLVDKNLKQLFRQAIDDISIDYTIGDIKTGDLAGVYSYDVFYNKTNYELAYKVEINDDTVIVVIKSLRNTRNKLITNIIMKNTYYTAFTSFGNYAYL